MSKLALLGGERLRQKPFVTQAVIGDEEKKRVLDVLDSGILSGFVAKTGDCFLGGKQVKEFEAMLKKYFNVKYAIAVNSATAGLHIAMGACNIGSGDEVIVPPYTMSASATAIVMQNATPVFVDIEDEDFCLNPCEVEKKITKKTKAIVVVHLFGRAANMKALMTIADKYKLYVIEDCAQSPGATYSDKFVGILGDIGIFSLNQHKTITSGEGGFAITNNDKLALRMQLMRNHGEVVVADLSDYENCDIVGFNYRMTELEAAVSVEQFKRLDYLNEYRIKLAEYLIEKLSKFNWLIFPKKNKDTHVYFVLPMRYKENLIGVSRDLFVRALVAEGIPFNAGYVKPIYLEPLYQQVLSIRNKSDMYQRGICPVCERMKEKELMITAICRYPHTNEDMDAVFAAFEKIYDNRKDLVGSKE